MTQSTRLLVSVIAAAVMLCAVAGVSVGQLQLKPPEIPSRFYTDRLVALEQEITALDRRIEDADKPAQLVLTSSKSLRMVARQLWLTGRAAGDEGSLAIVYAMTIEADAAAFDKLIAPLPGRVIEAFEAGDAKADELARLRRAVDALKQFNDGAGVSPASARARHIDAYLNEVLAPLAVVTEALGEPKAVSTWAITSAEAPAAKMKVDLAGLRKRIDGAPLAEATRGELRWLMDMVQRALAEPDLRPKAMGSCWQFTDLLDTADAFDRADWLDKLTRQQFKSQAHTAVLLFKDRMTRAAANDRLAQMSRMRGLLELLNQLAAHDDIDMAPLRQGFTTAYRLIGNESTADSAERLTSMLSRVAATALSMRSLEQVKKLPLDVRRPQQVLKRQYAGLERQWLASLEPLLADPSQISQPRWQQPIDQLESVALDVVNLNRVPEWVERMAKFNPHAARGLYKQLRLIANDLLNPATHAGASAAMVELERQLSLFETLPHEPMLDDAKSIIAKRAGAHRSDIAKQVTILRSQWAAAWAAGSDPTPAGRNLLLVRRLMIALHDGGRLLDESDRVKQLNRWAAWQVPADAAKPITQWLPGELLTAAEQAGQGDWVGLSATMDRIDRQGPAAWLMVRLADRLGPSLKRAPGGVAGLLSRTLYGPSSEAFGAAQRMDIARLCVSLAAATNERKVGTPATVAPLMEYASDLAARLLEWISGPSKPAAPANRTVDAIDV